MTRTWMDYEKLVATIYAKINTNATVTHNDKIPGKNSGRLRQIDVSIKQSLPGGHDIIVIISCKNYKRKPSIKLIDEFFGLLQDITASKGILICKAGFGETVKSYAKNRNIDLCTVYDLENRDWEGDLKIPLIYIRNKCELKINCSAIIPESLKEIQVPKIQDCIFSVDKKTFIKLPVYFVELWDNNLLDKKPNFIHKKYIEGLSWSLENIWYPIEEFIIEYEIKKTGKFKLIPPVEYFKIHHHTKDEKTEILRFKEYIDINDSSWKEVPNPEKLEIFFPGLYFVITENEKLTVDMLTFEE